MAKRKRKDQAAGKTAAKRPRRAKTPKAVAPPKMRFLDGVLDKVLDDDVGGVLDDVVGGVLDESDSLDSAPVADSPLAQAEEIVCQALEADGRRQVKMAHQALAVCPDCADAYVVLAEHANDLEEATELYAQGVAAGRRALGEVTFRQYEGEFWGMLETRPYMRARLGLAECDWTAGRREEAAEHFREMLRLNPNDNQGVRWTMAKCLLELDRDDELEHLLAEYAEDGSANWAYARALLAFRQQGDSQRAQRLLAEAIRGNRHVAAYLLDDVLLPQRLPDYFSPGEKDEAVLYAANYLAAWKATPGAISWLRRRVKAKQPRADESPASSAPVRADHLNDLPQVRDELWQADILRLPTWVEVDGTPTRPWLVLVTDRTNDLILAYDMSDRQPAADRLWEKLAEAMQSSSVGSPHRPGRVQLRSEDHRHAVGPYLEQCGIECVVSGDLDQLDSAYESLSESVRSGPSIPALIEVPGMGPEQVGSYFEAAAHFYREASWRRVPSDTVIHIECDKFGTDSWYGVVMGQSGMTLGLALYDDLKVLRKLLSGQMSEKEAARRTSAITVTFGEEFEMAIPDLDAAEQFGWPVVTPEAYPCAMRVNPGTSVRPPLTWELELLEGCLRAVPEFLAEETDAPRSMVAATSSGDLELVLSWLK